MRIQHLRHLSALLLTMLLGALLVACGGSTSTGSSSSSTATATPAAKAVTLNVFAAASLTESFNTMAKSYQQAHPNVTLKFNFAGSQQLAQQIISGAPADVFASADTTNMQKVVTPGLVDNPTIFAKNRLVVIIPKSNPGKINSLKDLANKGVKIDIEAPSVPAGKYTLQVLDKMAKSSEFGPAYVQAVKANFISQEDNVKAVVQKVQLGEADAGFVYRTDVTAAVASKLTVLDIPDQFNVIAQYPIAAVKHSSNLNEAQAFVQYVLSSDGQKVLAQYNFLPVSGS